MALNGRRFTARQVAAAVGETSEILTYFISKQKLELASESAGQGKERKHCLMDVYQVALLSELSRLTGNTKLCTATLLTLLISAVEMPVSGADGRPTEEDKRRALTNIASFKYDACLDARRANPVYWSRDEGNPYYIILVAPDRGARRQDYVHYVLRGAPEVLNRIPSGLFVNATSLFTKVDRDLLRLVRLEEGA